MAVTESFLLALFSMFSWGIADFIVVHPVRKIGSIRTLVIGQVAIFFMMLAYMLAFPGTIHFSGQSLLISFPPAFLMILGFLALYKGLRIGKVALVAPVVSSWSLVTVVIGFLVFHQIPTLNQAAAALLIVSGIFMAVVKVSEARSSIKKHAMKGSSEALLSMVFFGSSLAFGKVAIDEVGWLSATFLFSIWQTLMIAILFFPKMRDKAKVGLKYILIAAASGVLNFLGGLAYNLGISGEYLSVVSPIASASVLITVVLSFAILKERLTKLQYIGVLSVISGIIIMAI
ncbi:MAG: DMT family transporter [Candidatus Aenigmarchaeota archaeon]|nr:DMT family transporter [Candidatus Aenigmarchaeota archaeon]